MAQVYDVICPKCGQSFQIMKGVTMMEAQSGVEIPKSRDENEPDNCPNCNHQLLVNDPELRDFVKLVMLID